VCWVWSGWSLSQTCKNIRL